VLRSPTRNARPYVSVAEYGMGVSEISKPAVDSRNPNPNPSPRSSMALSRFRSR
jgi:hypothetical protein